MKKVKVENPRYPHLVKISREVIIDDPLEEGTSSTEVLYEGKGRCFTDTTTDGDGKVITNMRKASIPVNVNGWEQAVLSGDTIEVWKGKVKEDGSYPLYERGMVKDFEPDNDRTLVYWDMVRG